MAYTYNRQQQQTSMTDQRGCVHQYIYDLLGRLTNDCVPTLASGVDGTVLQLAMAYEVRGMVSGLTSYNSATVGSGSVVNDVQLVYNTFGQLITDQQSHSGAAGSGTPEVQYGYASGSANTIRPTLLTYPNSRAITISYGTTGGINDSASRVDSLIDGGTTTLVNYTYLGMSAAVQVTYPQPSTQYTLLGSSSGNNPVTGDIYWGLDLFGRIVDSRWFNTGTNADVDRIKYGYDQDSNRVWRQNPVATAAGAAFDEYYNYDGLQRLKNMQRGTLNGSDTAITSPTFGQCWTLDSTGNWSGFSEAAGGSSWTTVQSRTASTVNEITGITTTTGTSWANPAYDAAGNMMSIPEPVHRELAIRQMRLEINGADARRTLDMLPSECNPFDIQGIQIANIENGEFHCNVGRYGRLSNNITSLKREIRKSLHVGGESLSSVDLSCCQPALLVRLIRDGTDRTDTQTGGRGAKGTKYDGHFGTDFDLYCSLVQSGEFYDFMVEQLHEYGISRDEFKKRFLMDVLAKKLRYPSVVEERFAELFPTVYQFIQHVNRSDHANLIRLLQQAESQFVIETVAADFVSRHPTKFLIPLHDAIFTTPRNLRSLEQAFHRGFERTGFRMRLKVEA